MVVVTASGGGLAAGIALAVKARAPQARLYTAEPDGFDDHARSFRSGQRETNARVQRHHLRRADGPHARRAHLRHQPPPGRRGCVRHRCRKWPRRSAFAFRELKLVVEPGGRGRARGAVAGKLDIKGKVAVAVLSGGNVDPDLFYKLVA